MGLFGRLKEAGGRVLRNVGLLGALSMTTPGCNKESLETITPAEATRNEVKIALEPPEISKVHLAKKLREETIDVLSDADQIYDGPLDGIDFEEEITTSKARTTKAEKTLPPIPKSARKAKVPKMIELTEDDIEEVKDKDTNMTAYINPPVANSQNTIKSPPLSQTDQEFAAFIDGLNQADSLVNPGHEKPIKDEGKNHTKIAAVLPKRKEEAEVIITSGAKVMAKETLAISQKEAFSFNPSSVISEQVDASEKMETEKLAFDKAHQSILDTLDRHIEEIKLKNKTEEEAESLKNDFDALFDLWDKEKEVVENRKEAAKIRNVSMIALKEIVPYVQELEFNELNLRGMQNHLIKLKREIIRLQKMANDLSGKDHPLLEINSENQYVNQNENLRGALSSLVFDPIPTDLEKEKDLNRKALNLITDYERAIGQSERVREDLKFQISEIEFEHSELTKLVRSLATTEVNHFTHINTWKGDYKENVRA